MKTSILIGNLIFSIRTATGTRFFDIISKSCAGVYQNCQSWGNTFVSWNKIQNIPACIQNCYSPNRRLQQQPNFTPCPNFSMIFGLDVNGVYEVFDNMNFTNKLWLHNQTLPQLFNQDIILKTLISDLASRVSYLQAKSNNNMENPVTYLCWAWTFLTIALCLSWLVFKLVQYIKFKQQGRRTQTEENSIEQSARRRRKINTELSITELNQSIGMEEKVM